MDSTKRTAPNGDDADLANKRARLAQIVEDQQLLVLFFVGWCGLPSETRFPLLYR